MFPNYFMSQKARTKITANEEKDGAKIFLVAKDKKEQQKGTQKNQMISTKKNIKGRSRSKQSRKIGRKNYKTDIESEEDISDDQDQKL